MGLFDMWPYRVHHKILPGFVNDIDKYDRPMTHPHNTDVVLVDSSIIAQVPTRFLVAGMRDVLSTWFEEESCQK
jgi:glycerol dehydrogenase-like iron-containing ADH family enzyme